MRWRALIGPLLSAVLLALSMCAPAAEAVSVGGYWAPHYYLNSRGWICAFYAPRPVVWRACGAVGIYP